MVQTGIVSQVLFLTLAIQYNLDFYIPDPETCDFSQNWEIDGVTELKWDSVSESVGDQHTVRLHSSLPKTQWVEVGEEESVGVRLRVYDRTRHDVCIPPFSEKEISTELNSVLDGYPNATEFADVMADSSSEKSTGLRQLIWASAEGQLLSTDPDDREEKVRTIATDLYSDETSVATLVNKIGEDNYDETESEWKHLWSSADDRYCALPPVDSIEYAIDKHEENWTASQFLQQKKNGAFDYNGYVYINGKDSKFTLNNWLSRLKASGSSADWVVFDRHKAVPVEDALSSHIVHANHTNDGQHTNAPWLSVDRVTYIYDPKEHLGIMTQFDLQFTGGIETVANGEVATWDLHTIFHKTGGGWSKDP